MRDQHPKHLLAWYDQNARVLPWRVSPADRAAGVAPDPYRIWLSEIMLQQTTVTAVCGYFQKFVELWPGVIDLARAEDAKVMGEWAGLGYYARARNLLKCARIVKDVYGEVFPRMREDLLALPGIGPYTASAIAAIAFDQPATVVDGNVERVMSRLFLVETPLPGAKPELTRLAGTLTPNARPGDYAQAVMDLGASVCTPKNPTCGNCPCANYCLARAAGRQSKLPVRRPKKAKPIRHGIAYLAWRKDGAWLLETRPATGLLGGMLGWPGAEWSEAAPIEAPPIEANWQDPGYEVRHTFTHFHLRLGLRVASMGMSAEPIRGRFTADFQRSDLPTVMRKAFDMVAPGIVGF